MPDSPIRYFVFDVESVADGPLVAKIRYPGESLEATEAIRRYRQQLMDETGTDFIPYTYQIPISIVVAKVTAAFQLNDVVVLDEPRYRSHVMTEHFWRGWEKYDRPTLVTFNGRTFDLPLLELAAFRYGISATGWFATDGKTWEQPRNRYNQNAHLDLHDVLVNYGAVRFSGGLNLAANLLGKPGKIDVHGQMVQDMYDAGQYQQIHDYCRCDVLDTYFVFLRSRVLVGQLTLEREQELVGEARRWLEERADTLPAYQTYLQNWGDWANPWTEATPSGVAEQPD